MDMQIKSLFLILISSIVFVSSCDRFNPPDNASTIALPYALFIGESEGGLWKTNNAVSYERWIANGSAFTNELFVADTNVIQIKQKMTVYNGIRKPFALKQITNFTPLTNTLSPEKPGQMNIAWHNKPGKNLWCCAISGLWTSVDNGSSWQSYVSPPPVVAMGVPTSITQMDDGNLIVLNVNNKLFRNINGAVGTAFTAVTSTGIPSVAGINPDWALAKENNRLWMIDETGNFKPIYSDNYGASFTASSGFPTGKRVNMAKQVDLNKGFYLGTDSAGLWKSNGNVFQKINGGLPETLRIWDIEAKRQQYTTGETKDFMFLATDQGIYMSENSGNDWKKVSELNCSALR